MRDLANKMAELKFEAPLAQCEDSDEWSGPVDYQNNNNNNSLNNNTNLSIKGTLERTRAHKETDNEMALMGGNDDDDICKESGQEKDEVMNMLNAGTVPGNRSVENFNEMTSGSLEDLVNTFDEKITKCFGNYEQSVEELAPVQMRSQEEIMSECQ